MAFKNTILGRILKGASKVFKPVAIIGATLLGVGALAGVVKGAGALGGVKNTLSGIGDAGKKMVDLVSGTTADERAQVKQVKAEAKAAQDKLDQVDRLIAAGATRAKAMQMAGVTADELGSTDAPQKQAELDASAAASTTPMGGAPTPTQAGCMVLFIPLVTGLISVSWIACYLL